MASTLKIGDLVPGEYRINSFDMHQTKYGRSYVIESSKVDNDEVYYFWSNSYLANYISNEKPKSKFNIFIDAAKKISIVGYNTKTILI